MLQTSLNDLLRYISMLKVMLITRLIFIIYFQLKFYLIIMKLIPFFKDNKLIKLSLIINGYTYNIINLFDSYLILSSLFRNLADKYNVPVQKGIFPYKFVN